MKISITLLALFCIQVWAQEATVEPIPSKTPGREKVEKIKTHGGALKIEDKPAKMEGWPPPEVKEKEKSKNEKKKSKGGNLEKQDSKEIP